MPPHPRATIYEATKGIILLQQQKQSKQRDLDRREAQVPMLALKGQLLTVENGDITRRPATAEELLSIPLSDPYLFLRPSFFWSDELRDLYCKLRGCGSLKSNVKGREHSQAE